MKEIFDTLKKKWFLEIFRKSAPSRVSGPWYDLLIAQTEGFVESGSQHSPSLYGSLICGKTQAHLVPSPRA